MINHDSIFPVATRYTYSVNLQHDFQSITTSLVGYQATPLVLETIEQIVDSLYPDASSRAFSIIGPYGSGKSAFALFLCHYLSVEPSIRHELIEKHSDGIMTQCVSHTNVPALFPVVISGNNSSLRLSLLETLRESLASNTEKGKIVDYLAKLDTQIALGDSDPQMVANLISEASYLVSEHSPFAGILLIVDELGQYLDYIAQQKSQRDLFVLQTVAEMATRSGQVPCLFVTIHHQTFDKYVGTTDDSQKTEWSRIQGRFTEISFLEPEDNMPRIVAQTLCPDLATDRYSQARLEWAEKIVPHTEELGLRPNGINQQEWSELLARCYPVHPTVLAILPSLFHEFAQSKRSLFAFLTSYAPCSVPDFVSMNGTDTTTLPIYRLTHLYDYIKSTLGSSIYSDMNGRLWSELAETCLPVSKLGALPLDAIKVIGTINASGQHRTIHTNKAIVSFALKDDLQDLTVSKVLEELKSNRFIVHRMHRDSFVLWEGSDLDLEELVQAARRKETDRRHIASLLESSADTMPFVAQEHSYITGSIRHFAIRFVDVSELPKELEHPTESDGIVWYVVPMDDEERELAQQWAAHEQRTNELQHIALIPKEVRYLNDLVLDVFAMQHVLENQPELENDRVAKRELAYQLDEAQQLLADVLHETYRIDQSEWWWNGTCHKIESSQELDDMLSRICDIVFHATPHIWNELINRRRPKPAYIKLRRKMIEAMLNHENERQLGIIGYPTELVVYENIFRATGLHRQDGDGRWQFMTPPPEDSLHLQPVWDAMKTFMDSTQNNARPIEELYAIINAPPYGVKEGLIPLLFIAIYLTQAGSITFYQHGNYVPVPDLAMFELLLKQPKHFSIRLSRVVGSRVVVYERLAHMLAPELLTTRSQPALLDVVKPLLSMVKQLPEFSHNTKNVSEIACAIRQALISAKSPDELIFSDLPRACGIEPFGETDSEPVYLELFFSQLQEGIKELRSLYPSLIENVAEHIRNAFRTTTTNLAELQQELLIRYRAIAESTSDNQVRAFGVRLETSNPGTDWIESVGMLVRRKAMKGWNDNDTDEFAFAINDLGRRFCHIEQIAIAMKTVPDAKHVIRIGLTDLQGEKNILLHMTEMNDDMQELHQKLEMLLQQYTHLSNEQKMVVLKNMFDPMLVGTDWKDGGRQ